MLPYAALNFQTKRKDSSFLCESHYLHLRNFFLFSSILSLTRQFFGDAIVCHRDRAGISDELLETYCLANGTFTVRGDRSIVHHDYYQWVPLFLILQALISYLPYHIWTQHSLASLLKAPADIIIREIRRSGQNAFGSLVALEVAYFIVLLFQAVSVDRFLGGVKTDLFPLDTNCTLNYYTGGMLTQGRFRCLLPLNVLYNKVFIVGCVAFALLAFLHCVVLAYRLALYRWKTLRGGGPFADDVHRWWMYRTVINNVQEPWKLEEVLLSKPGETPIENGILLQLEPMNL